MSDCSITFWIISRTENPLIIANFYFGIGEKSD